MLDIKFVRENSEIVKQNIKNKFQDQKLGLVDEVREKENFQADRCAHGPGQEGRGRGDEAACQYGCGEAGKAFRAGKRTG